jgi:hypothetical protein
MSIDLRWEKNGVDYDLFIKNSSIDYVKDIIKYSYIEGINSRPTLGPCAVNMYIDFNSIINKKFSCNLIEYRICP